MAKSQQDRVNWQSTKKTVLERSRHMFNNPFMSDIMFSCEGSDKKFFAHKYVLGTSSAVFYAMFYGELAEKNSVVHLSDTSEESLEEFLRFLYTDGCNLTADNAVFALYLAKKYIVPSLAQKCIKFLEANLGVENAVTILQQAIQLNEKKLEKKCWDLIDLKTSKAIASDAFADINQATLEKLLKRESLKIKEVDLFKAVLKRSEAECLRKGIEANSNNKRSTMGNAIYQIRFASMTLQEFGQNVSQSGILTLEENVLFYDKFSGIERASEVWNLSERGAREEILLRCCRFENYGIGFPSMTTSTCVEEELAISFSKPVKIHGVRLLGVEGNEYDVKLEIWSQKIEKKFQADKRHGVHGGFDVMLPLPIQVQADSIVHLKATVTGHRAVRHSPARVKRIVKTNGTTVHFFNISYSGRTPVDQEIQIDEIIFSEM